jgi:hypothetical protein
MMLHEHCKEPSYRCQYIAGPIRHYAEANHFLQGYLFARKENGQEPSGEIVTLLRNVQYTCDMIGFPSRYNDNGFYVVRKTALSKEESDTLVREREKILASKRLEAAEKELDAAKKQMQRVSA